MIHAGMGRQQRAQRLESDASILVRAVWNLQSSFDLGLVLFGKLLDLAQRRDVLRLIGRKDCWPEEKDQVGSAGVL